MGGGTPEIPEGVPMALASSRNPNYSAAKRNEEAAGFKLESRS
jgi:hypothetical protein